MYVDEYRLRKGPHDASGAVCTDPACPYPVEHLTRTGNLVPFHRVSTNGCSGREDYVIECALKQSKHRPHKPDASGVTDPF